MYNLIYNLLYFRSLIFHSMRIVSNKSNEHKIEKLKILIQTTQ